MVVVKIGEKMKELTKEDFENFKEWSEGNKYLYELLLTCKENDIETFSSCGGHEITLDTPYEEEDYNILPYISIALNEGTIDVFKQIMDVLKDTQNIQARIGYNGRKEDGADPCVLYAHHSNCCEMFGKIKYAIESEHVIDNKSKMNFFERITSHIKARNFVKAAEKRIKQEGKSGKDEDIYFDTYTKELNSYIVCEGHGFANRHKIKNFDKLYKKYSGLQKEYNIEADGNISELLEPSKKETLPSLDLANWKTEQNQVVESKKIDGNRDGSKFQKKVGNWDTSAKKVGK